MKFNKLHFLISEDGARSAGEEMEYAITSAFNGDVFNIPGIDEAAANKVAEFLKLNHFNGKAQVVGQMQVPVSKKWEEYWAPNIVPSSTKTPKTDIIIGKSKLSLKTGDAAQLMSAGANESKATFYAALDQLKTNPKSIIDDLVESFKHLAPSSTAKGKIGSELKKGLDKKLNEADKAHKVMMLKLKNQFESNPEFAFYFAKEAMSGEVKFGGNDGTCTHFLCVNWDGANTKVHVVDDSTYVKKIATQMRPSVRFKSMSEKIKVDGKTVKTGRYRYWSVVGLIVDKLTEEIDLRETKGEILTESFFDSIWSFIKNILDQVIEFISKSWKNLLEFLEIEPEVQVETIVNVR